MDATQRINELISLVASLGDLLAQENKALQARRIEEVAGLLDGKNALTRSYVAKMEALKETPEVLNEVDSDLIERLQSMGEKVNELVGQNAFLLKVAMESNKRVVHSIAEAVKSASQPGAGTYSARGSVGTNGNGRLPESTPISLDETL
jgi:flagellar biosynthesis/type III secretory pathway chaperone